MTNHYEAPEVRDIGKAGNLILQTKDIGLITDSFCVPFLTDGDTFDDFDE